MTSVGNTEGEPGSYKDFRTEMAGLLAGCTSTDERDAVMAKEILTAALAKDPTRQFELLLFDADRAESEGNPELASGRRDQAFKLFDETPPRDPS